MLLSMLIVPAHAAGTCLAVSKTTLEPEETFTLSYTVPNSVSGVDAIAIEIGFDKTKFEATNIVYADIDPLVRDTNHTVTQANTNGKFRGEWSSNDETFETATTAANLKLFDATFKVKAGASAGTADFTVDILEIADEIADDLCGAAGATKTKATVNIFSTTKITGTQNITGVTAPAKGATPVNTVAPPTGVLADISWYKDGDSSPFTGSTFEANTTYSAKITVKPDTGYAFADTIAFTVDGSNDWTSAKQADGSYILTKTFPATADKDPATLTAAPTGATGLIYNGTEQELLATNGSATGGTMQYKLGSDGTWSGDIPKATDADEYTVYYKAKGDSSHSDSEVKSVTVIIAPMNIGDSDVEVKPIPAETYDGTEKTPAPVVQNRDDPLTLDIDYTVTYSNHINAGTATVTIQGIGNYGSHRTENFTIKNAVQTITVPTEAQTISFGNTLDLNTVCSSNAPGAVLTFAVKSGSTLPADTTLSGSTVTAGTTEGNFTVTVNSVAVTNYEAAVEQEFTVKIVSLPPAGLTTPPAAKPLTYNGAAQELVTAGIPEGGTMMYNLTGGTGWTSPIPKGTDAGSYTVYYMVRGDEDHSDFTPADNTVSVTISKKDAAVKPKSFTITKGSAIPTFELAYTGLVGSDTLTPSETPAFTCYESDGITPVSASTPAGTYTITWTNESSTTFTGADNYNLTATETATLTIKNKKPSGGSGSSSGGSFGGGYRLPMKPADDTFSQPAGCVSDTIGDVNVSGAYQFRLTSTNGSTPVVTLSDTAFHGVFASQEGNDYFYKVYADGQPGQTCIVTVNGTTVARLTIVSASGSGVISDTTAPFTVPQGGAYQFRLTADTKPTMTAGSPSFTVAYVGNEGKDWFFKVYAVGQPGDGCGFYINGAPVPVAVARIS